MTAHRRGARPSPGSSRSGSGTRDRTSWLAILTGRLRRGPRQPGPYGGDVRPAQFIQYRQRLPPGAAGRAGLAGGVPRVAQPDEGRGPVVPVAQLREQVGGAPVTGGGFRVL